MKTTADFWLTNTGEHWTKHGNLSKKENAPAGHHEAPAAGLMKPCYNDYGF